MIETALTWVLTVVSLLIGYWIGSKTSLAQPIAQLKSIMKARPKPTKVGGIRLLNNNEIKKRGSKLEETEQAILETYNKEMIDE